MRYPLPLKKGDTIGIVATSSGVTGAFSKRIDKAISHLKELNYDCVEMKSVRSQKKLVSASPEERAKAFTELYLDETVKAIVPPWGGRILLDMLPHLDFELLAEAPPKWVLGFSDTSTLLLALTTNLNIATAHGPNLLDFGADPVHETVYESLELLKSKQGDESIQQSTDYYQKDWFSIADNNYVPYNLTEKTTWKALGDYDAVEMQGRLIGGCLDVICKLIGTPYAPLLEFQKRNNDKGFIWYFESCMMDAADIYSTLLQMKMSGWFDYCNGLVYGRLEGYKDVSDFTFIDALNDLKLDIPVIYDVDIGHLPPQLTLINGAFATLRMASGKGVIEQRLV